MGPAAVIDATALLDKAPNGQSPRVTLAHIEAWEKKRGPILDINDFAYPAAFTVGSAGRNITTGTRLLWSQVSAAKNIPLGERFNFQVRWDFQNARKTCNFNPPDTTVNSARPREFGKLTADPRTASLGGQPLMNLTLQLSW